MQNHVGKIVALVQGRNLVSAMLQKAGQVASQAISVDCEDYLLTC